MKRFRRAHERAAAIAGFAALATGTLFGPRSILNEGFAAFHAAALAAGAALVLLLVLARRRDMKTDHAAEDPIRRAFFDRTNWLIGPAFAVCLTFFLFPDVLFLGRTMVSAPFWNVADDPGKTTAGFGYLNDAWAGYLIEGPGLAIGRRFDHGDAREAPLWNPYEGAGAPFLANGEVAAMSLLQAPLNRSPSIAHWDRFALARQALAFFFAFLWIRGLGRSRTAALFGATAFGFGAYFVQHANLVHLNTEVMTPLVLLAADGLFFRPGVRRTLLLAGAIGFGLNGGNPQPLVVALLAVLIRFACVTPPRPGPFLSRAALGTLALVLGAGLSAVTLFPLAQQLQRSVTRALLAPSGVASLTSLLAFAAPHGGENAAALELRQPSLWYVGATVAITGIAGFMHALSTRKREDLALALPLLVLLSTFFVPAGVTFFGEILPVLSSVNWPKYVGTTALFFGALAALWADRAAENRPATRAAAGWSLFFFTALLVAARDGLSLHQRTAMLTALVLFFAALLFHRVFRRHWAAFLPLFLAGEFAAERSFYPERRAAAETAKPPLVRFLEEAQAAERAREGTIWRTLPHGDVLPPLLSGTAGFFDVRTTTPVPLAEYHDWIAPYVNCGAWPPYLLLGATREMLLSPCVDLLGVRWIVIKDHRLLAAQLDQSVEDLPTARFGGLHRAIDSKTFHVRGAEAIDPDRATFTMAKDGEMRFDLALVARTAKIGFVVDSPADARVDMAIGKDRRTLAAEKEEIFTVDGAPDRTPFALKIVAGDHVRVRISHWEADRFRPKSLSDFRFDLDPRMVDRASGVMALYNKNALPIARLSRRVRPLKDARAFRGVWERFVKTGDGFAWRDELLIYPRTGESLPEFPTDDLPIGRAETARLEMTGMNTMKAVVTVERPAWLHVAAADDGDWKARIDGTEIPIVRANGPFMAVPIGRTGTTEVEFSYEPRAYALGKKTSGVCAAICMLGLAATFLGRKKIAVTPRD